MNIAPENTFHTLPEAFTQPDRVESLYLHDDHLTALPDDLRHLPNLRALRLAMTSQRATTPGTATGGSGLVTLAGRNG